MFRMRLIAVVFLALLPACIQFRMTLQVNSDGSGKVVYRFGSKSGALDFIEAFGGG